MRRKGTDAQLAVIRQRGLALLEQGKKTKEVAELLGVIQRMGWSSQRPQRVALQRDDEAIERWKEEELPRIKKVSPTGRYPRSGR